MGSKSTAMLAIDSDSKNTPYLQNMLIVDDKSTIVYGFEEFKKDRKYMRDNPQAVTRVSRRGPQFSSTTMGEAMWMCEMGHKINLE